VTTLEPGTPSDSVRTTGETRGPAEEIVVLSDVHLTEVIEPKIEGWWAYKTAQARQDGALSSLMSALHHRRPRAYGRTHLVFNGDTWDFDLVYGRPPGVAAPIEGLPINRSGSLYKMGVLIGDHRVFIHALARFCARGGRVTFVLGNHDRELAYPSVQALLRGALAAASPPGAGALVASRVAFEPWFVYVPGVCFLEHGQQYDATCSYRDVLDPFLEGPETPEYAMEPSLGSIAGRLVISRSGAFNPYDDDSFLRSATGYVKYWLDHYFMKRSMVYEWVVCAIKLLGQTIFNRYRALARTRDTEALYGAYARSRGVSDGFIALLKRLWSKPCGDNLPRLFHEMWADRIFVLVAAGALLGVGISRASSWVEGALLLTLIPLVGLVIRAMGRGSLALIERGRWGLVAEQISGRLGVSVVAFGHSHRPERRPLSGGGRYYNLGTWAPVAHPELQGPLMEARRYLVLRPRPQGGVWVSFEAWREY
jgi:hypothetical protein